jgi:RpiR family carbohydrate utilization transcriptional regulator
LIGLALVTNDDASAAEEPFSALALIRTQSARLPAGEARVAQAILEEPYAALAWSAQELAERAGTSSATAIRACHRLGFEGLPHLRIALARELGWTRLWSQTPPSGPEGSLKTVFSATADALAAVGGSIDEASFRSAAEALARAERLLLVCAGPTQVVCQDAMFDLISIDRPAEFSADSMLQTLSASKLSARDVCVAVGISGANELTLGAAQAAAKAGATVVAITGFPHSELARLADIKVIVGGPDIPFSVHGTVSLVAMLLTMRAMTMAVADLTGRRDRSPLQETLGTAALPVGSARRRPRAPKR